jgi:hypothetical protein
VLHADWVLTTCVSVWALALQDPCWRSCGATSNLMILPVPAGAMLGAWAPEGTPRLESSGPP